MIRRSKKKIVSEELGEHFCPVAKNKGKAIFHPKLTVWLSSRMRKQRKPSRRAEFERLTMLSVGATRTLIHC